MVNNDDFARSLVIFELSRVEESRERVGESREGLRECSLYILVPEAPPGPQVEKPSNFEHPRHLITPSEPRIKR